MAEHETGPCLEQTEKLIANAQSLPSRVAEARGVQVLAARDLQVK